MKKRIDNKSKLEQYDFELARVKKEQELYQAKNVFAAEKKKLHNMKYERFNNTVKAIANSSIVKGVAHTKGSSAKVVEKPKIRNPFDY